MAARLLPPRRVEARIVRCLSKLSPFCVVIQRCSERPRKIHGKDKRPRLSHRLAVGRWMLLPTANRELRTTNCELRTALGREGWPLRTRIQLEPELFLRAPVWRSYGS